MGVNTTREETGAKGKASEMENSPKGSCGLPENESEAKLLDIIAGFEGLPAKGNPGCSRIVRLSVIEVLSRRRRVFKAREVGHLGA
jgi:hypothetical protein